ncbi:MAG: MFS transporter [Actinomycetes bacterium]
MSEPSRRGAVHTHGSYRRLAGNKEVVAVLTWRGISALGDQVARAVLALVVLQRSDGGPVLSALVLAIGYLPLTFGSAFLGSLADRFPRRAVIMVCEAARAVLVVGLAVIVTAQAPLWTVLALLLVAEMFGPPSAAASQALLPDLARDHSEYQTAYAVRGTVDQAMQVLGFVVGGIALQTLSAGWALLFDALTFVVGFIMVWVFVHPRPSADVSGTSARRLVDDMRIGARTVRSTPALRWLALLAWTSAALLVATDGAALPYAAGEGASDAASTALLAATPAGAAIAAVWVGRLSMARQMGLLFPLAGLSTVPMVATGFDPGLRLTWVLWFGVGLCQGYVVTVMTLTVILSPLEQRGRVSGLVAAGFNGVAALSLLVIGLLTSAVTAAFAVSITGSVGLVAVLLLWMLWPQRDVRQAVRTTYGATSRRL